MANRGWTLIAVSSFYLFGCAASERASVPVSNTSVASQFAPVLIPTAAPPTSKEEAPTYTQSGIASWYRESGRFKRTANGEKPEPMRLTAAHRFLPFGTIVRVMSLRTGRSVLVRINDRGPFVRKRIIDLSYAAAATLGILDDGLTNVSVAVFRSDQCDVSSKSTVCSEKTTATRSVQKLKQAVRKRTTKSSLSARSDHRTERLVVGR
jgi:rare lipoprotein A